MSADQSASTPTCFVIGPIGNRLADIGTAEREAYEQSLRVVEEVVKPACASVGLEPVRADELSRAGEINEQIFRRLHDDDVVIADLTGANANVMYELGLRHTRDLLTVQIGEFGRLPFDINTIRTIQFSPSTIGLINARDELAAVLAAGLAGEYDPVAATRVWFAEPEEAPREEVAAVNQTGGSDSTIDDADGFLDIMARAEEQLDRLAPALNAVSQLVVELGDLATTSSQEMTRSDAAGNGMKGRLAITTRYASGMDQINDRLEAAVDDYGVVLRDVSAGTLAMIDLMGADDQALDDGQEFGMVTRRAAATTRESMSYLADLAAIVKENARLARVLRPPSDRLTSALARWTEATATVDEWDRRLQALGIPLPPEDWEPDEDARSSELDSSGDE